MLSSFLSLSLHTLVFLKYIYPVVWRFLLFAVHPAAPTLFPHVPLSIPLWSWNISGHILNPTGCAGRGRRVSWRAQQPSSPSWCGKYSEDSGSDRAAETPMTADPTLPCCFFLKGSDTKIMSWRSLLKNIFLFFYRHKINSVQSISLCRRPAASTMRTSGAAATAPLWKVKSTWLLQHIESRFEIFLIVHVMIHGRQQDAAQGIESE